MKFLIFSSIYVLFTPLNFFAQDSQERSVPFKIEWKTEIPVGKTEVSGLVIHNQNIYLTQTGGASVFNILNSDGGITYTAMANNTRIRSLFTYDGFLYSMGDQHLTKRVFGGAVIKEVMLPWVSGEYISTTNGTILKNIAYTFAFGDLMKFSLNGDQLYRKQVAKLCNNQKLCVGGEYIYLYGQISDPAVGFRLMLYDTLGNQKWSVPVGDVYAMVADKDGKCYIMVANGETTVLKFDPEGQVVWSKLLKGQYAQGASIWGDSLLLCGNISLNAITDNGQSCAYSIMSISSGEILQQQTLDLYEDKMIFENMNHMVTDGNVIYIGGTHTYWGTSNCFLVKLSREGNTTGLKETSNSRSFNIFPNPGGSNFTIACENTKSGTLNITVRNSLGQVVKKKEISCEGQKSFEFELGKQPSGNYTVEIVSGKEKVVKKILVE